MVSILYCPAFSSYTISATSARYSSPERHIENRLMLRTIHKCVIIVCILKRQERNRFTIITVRTKRSRNGGIYENMP